MLSLKYKGQNYKLAEEYAWDVLSTSQPKKIKSREKIIITPHKGLDSGQTKKLVKLLEVAFGPRSFDWSIEVH